MSTTTENTFLKLQPRELQHVYNFYKSKSSSGVPHDEIKSALITELSTRYPFSEDESRKIVTAFYDQLSSPGFSAQFIDASASPSAHIILTHHDYAALITQLTSSQEEDPQIISLLIAFLAIYRYNFHPSMWIKYDRKAIFHLAGLTRLKNSEQENLTKYLHNHYNLEMRVIGSNNPIPCFFFPWLVVEGVNEGVTRPSGDEEVTVDFGPLLPETIASIRDQIQQILSNHKEEQKNICL